MSQTHTIPLPQNASRVPPGPKGLPLIGVGLKFARDPIMMLGDVAREYGDIVTLPLNNDLKVALTPAGRAELKRDGTVSQVKIEPALRDAIIDHPLVEARWGVAFEDFVQDGTGVTCTLRMTETGAINICEALKEVGM